uniref:Beta-1,4-N-acetylgalactosaminyltransferase n=1 Tax=Parastrongyloides trichosuri TaxID=131310 RepID=A0A0N5A051_PARTI
MFWNNKIILLLRTKEFICVLLFLIFELLIYVFFNNSTLNFVEIIVKESSDPLINGYKFKLQNPELPYCSYKNYTLLYGDYRVELSPPSLETIESLYPDIQMGGHHYPKSCKANQTVAIIVPYKNREEHLKIFLYNLHDILQRQLINYIIFLIEPTGNGTFNRGKLLNIGFVEGMKLYNFDCFIFHDVDLIPENDKHLYECSDKPKHMSSHINKFNYKLIYGNHFGGVCALTSEQFRKVNGFNNNYWGWGMEDDDLFSRISFSNMSIVRDLPNVSRYFMVKHERDPLNPVNPCRFKIQKYFLRNINIDGLNTLNYTLKKVEYHKLFTKILVDLLEESSRRMLYESYLKGIKCKRKK